MKKNKSLGPYEIPAEVIKEVVEMLFINNLHLLFQHIWAQETIKQQLKDAKIYKWKESRSDCGGYRGFNLLSITGKILAQILITRLPPQIRDNVLLEAQCGFHPQRSTDMIIVDH